MRFNNHSRRKLKDKHSFLSPSKYSWIRYDDDKLARMFTEELQRMRGAREHAFAAEAISLGHRMPDVKKTMNMYVNDALGYRLSPEVELYWSDWCFGTADAIGYSNVDNTLRVFDLKTGRTATKIDQLMIYAALFCLEYEMRPFDITIELRIYQGNQARIYDPTADEIFHIMDRIVTGTRIIEEIVEDQLAA